MRMVVNQGELEDKIVMTSKAVAKKTAKPVLSGFLFEVSSEGVFVNATDLETGVRATVQADEVEGEGKFVVDASTFLDIVKNLPNDVVVLEYDEDVLNISSGRSSFSLSTMDASEFPEFSFAETDSFVEIDTSILEDMIDKVIYAAATDEFMKNLNGVYWEFTDTGLRLVASDGFRLALIEQNLESTLGMSFLISLKSMKELQNVISNTSEPAVRLRYDGKRFSVEAGDVQVTMRVVDADFPDYRRVLPKEYNTKVVLSKTEALDALKRTMIIAKKGSDAVKLEASEDGVILTSRSPDYGEAREELEADFEGENIEAAFNPKFLQEAFRNVDTEEIELYFVSSTAPLKIKGFEKEEYFYIVMPIRLA
ncbi:MAG: DNA polymerase III subunit beta [Thermotogaceae bacterium]|nr:DNA polymerase III subunit beta [Thermotogaceae bacterium]